MQLAYLHEGLDFPDVFEAGDDYGFDWLNRRALWCRTTILQSALLSLLVHLAIITIFFPIPRNVERVKSPWLEVRLVSLGSGDVATGLGEGGGAGGSSAMDPPVAEHQPTTELLPPKPTQPTVENPREVLPKPLVKLAATRPRSASKPREPDKVPAPQREMCEAEPLSGVPAQPAAAVSAGAASAQGLGEFGAGGSGIADGGYGSGQHGGHGGGPVDAEFGAANGPRFAHKSLPKYPRLARQLGKEGIVVLRVTIDERGRPIAVETVKTAGSGFDEEATRAVRESVFHPAKREGKPVICRALLPIRFELKGSD